jgi:hypothetical protein
VALEPHEFDHPSRTDRGDGRCRGPTPCTARGSSVIRMRQGTVPRESSPRDGVLALAFRTLLSFQGTSPGCSSATRLRFPRLAAAGAAGRYHGPFKFVKVLLPDRTRYSWWSPARHVGTFTQKRRPAPHPSERQDGHRTAAGRILLAFGDLLSSDADAAGVVPERSSVLKNFPAYSSQKVAPGSTPCQLTVAVRIPTTTTVPGAPVFPPGPSSAPGGPPRERRPSPGYHRAQRLQGADYSPAVSGNRAPGSAEGSGDPPGPEGLSCPIDMPAGDGDRGHRR